MRRFALLFSFASLVLYGCASTDEYKDWTAEQFYSAASAKVESGNYVEAIRLFELLQGRYPYGRLAEQAQIQIAYSHYKNEEPAMALAACDRFIRQYPTHANVDYVYYLKGIINFSGERKLSQWLFGTNDDVFDYDPKAVREAYGAFKELVDRFPNSGYAEDARARIRYLYSAQARYEVNVARFYYKQGAYVAAVNRAKYALENFPQTPAIEDALGISALSYKKMGLDTLYTDTLRILSSNYPNSTYLKKLKS